MKTLSQIITELEDEIATRKSLKAQMVGQLYPAVLHDEIRKLEAAKTCLQTTTNLQPPFDRG